MNTSSKCILFSYKDADPELSKTVSRAIPLSSQDHQNIPEDTILMAGGFSAAPPSPYPHSPSLQLNADLTDMDMTELKALAQAELKRHHSPFFPSYVLEADCRITLLGTDAAMLHDFMECYSGILDISPILLEGYDQDLTRAQDLNIHENHKGFTITFSIKQPVKLSQCTHCGACGSACPERCLNEQLFLDFDRCSLCKECVAVCDFDALDLHGVEERELTTPAIVTLQGAEGFVPENITGVYSIATLPDLFATLYMREVEEVIGWNSNFCQYSPRLQVGCSACFDACSHNAIRQDRKGIHIDHPNCVECGACLSACPSAALHYRRFTDSLFLEYLKDLPLRPGTLLVLGDEAALHSYWWQNTAKAHKNVFFLEFPQTAALHAMHFLLLSTLGARQIVLLSKESRSASAQMQFVNQLLSGLLNREQTVTTCNVDELRDTLARDRSTSPQATQATQAKSYQDFSYQNRRLKVVDILRFLRMQNISEDAIAIDESSPDFGEISCDPGLCTGCMACINECRMGALSAGSTGYSLSHIPALCVQCGICVSICPEDALTPHRGLLLDEHFFDTGILAHSEPAKCKGCGKVFGTQKSLEKVMDILSSKNMWDKSDDLLAYCDACRVVNLYQSVEQ